MISRKSPTEADRDIGARIRSARLARGVSQEQLAGKLGLTFQQVQKYEKGANRVSASRLEAIARVLGADVMSFYAGAGPTAPRETAIDRVVATRDGRAVIDRIDALVDPDVRRIALGAVIQTLDLALALQEDVARLPR